MTTAAATPGEFVPADAFALPIEIIALDPTWASPPCRAFSTSVPAFAKSPAPASQRRGRGLSRGPLLSTGAKRRNRAPDTQETGGPA